MVAPRFVSNEPLLPTVFNSVRDVSLEIQKEIHK